MRRLLLCSLLIFVTISLSNCGDSPTGPNGDEDPDIGDNGDAVTYTVTTGADPSDGGTVSPEGENSYDEGDEIELEAAPADGYLFVEWVGDVESTDNPQTLTVNQDYEITAVFEKRTYPLTVEKVGEGTVTEEVIQEKTTEYEEGTVVELSAEPDTGWTFAGWEGYVTSSDPTLQITVEEPVEITAVFEVETYVLTIEDPEGGTINAIPMEEEYEFGTDIELNAVAGDGFEFVEWTGDINSTENPYSFTIESDMTISAEFEETSSNLFYLDDNNVTVMCPDAEVGDEGTVDGTVYTKRTADQITPENAEITCTSDITDMSLLFSREFDFNGDISHWDVSSVMDMASLFDSAREFNQDLSAWDVSNVTNMRYMFSAALVFDQDLKNWDVSNVTNMEGMFNAAFEFDGDVKGWDVSNVTNMNSMFGQAYEFNQDIGDWDVSNVTDMSFMFSVTNEFNQNLNNWDVSGVIEIKGMFELAKAFNQNLNNWDVSNVTSMQRMFNDAEQFNGNIGDWDVSNVTNMQWMFWNAVSFNRDINSWDVSNVTRMWAMFRGAGSFNQQLNSWDVSSVTHMGDMFREAENFNRSLNSWDTSSVDNMSSMFKEATNFNGNIGSWDVTNVTQFAMESMFEDAESFNQNLSFWCVDHISSEPDDFATGSDLDFDNKPDWGNCP